MLNLERKIPFAGRAGLLAFSRFSLSQTWKRFSTEKDLFRLAV